MKYSSSNKPLVCMQTQSTCYKGTNKMTVKGVLWHDTGANNKTLKRYVQPSDTKPAEDTYSKTKWLELLGTNGNKNDWNHIERQAGLNCWVGTLADGTVTTVQTMPWNYRPWGCGKGSKGSCNDGWIQFEICQDAKTDKAYFDAAYKEACEITAYLCKMFDIDPKGTVTHNGVKVPTIICHQDSYKLGLGSNHSDMYDWFNLYGKTMDNVRNDVAALLGGTTTTITESKKEMRYFKIVDPTGMNMRTEPNKTLVQNIPQGTVINGDTFKTANNVDWVYTTYNGKSGYVAVLPESKGYAVEVTSEYNKPEPTPAVDVVKTYEVVTELNRYSTVADAVNKTNSKGIYTKGTYYIYEKYPDGSKGMFNISTDKTGKSAGSWINPSENVISQVVEQPKVEETPKAEETPKVEETSKKVYELDFPTKHNICESVKTDVNYEKKFTQVCESILKNNPSFDIEIVKAFFKLAPLYRIDQVRAISQSILETGWFKYSGSAVIPEHHNYCGLGVTVNGKPGNIFDTIENGVRAQLQHLYAYGCKDAIPAGETLVDERFKYVTRGIAPTWEELAGRWAVPGYDGNDPEAAMKAGTTYGQKIDTIYNTLMALNVSQETIEKYFDKVDSEASSNDHKVDQKEPAEPENNAPEINEPTTVSPEANKPENIESEPLTTPSGNNIIDIIFNCLSKLVQFIFNLLSNKK